MKPTWNHENHENKPGTMKNYKNRPGSMKNQPGTMINHENRHRAIKNQLWTGEGCRAGISKNITDKQTLFVTDGGIQPTF